MWNRAILLMLLTLGIAPAGVAQFVGDVYFEQPSIAVAEGATGELAVLVFTGDKPLGAAHVELTYNPAELEIVATEPGGAIELQDTFVSDNPSGRLAFVAINDESLERPIGTVSLATIEVRPLASAGARTQFDLKVEGLLDGRSIGFSATSGFAGEVLVTSEPGAAPAARSGGTALFGIASTPEPPSDDERVALEERAAKMGRPGQKVDIAHRNPEGGVTSVEVTVEPIPSGEGAPAAR